VLALVAAHLVVAGLLPLVSARSSRAAFGVAAVLVGASFADARLAALDAAAKPKAALEFPAVPALRRLVIAAFEQPRLGQLKPAEWKAQVDALAAPPAKKP
jgi:hypothetical protein